MGRRLSYLKKKGTGRSVPGEGALTSHDDPLATETALARLWTENEQAALDLQPDALCRWIPVWTPAWHKWAEIDSSEGLDR